MPQQTWLITGCSSGFGEQFVRSLLARGDKVIATGRNAAEKLAHLNDTGAAILDLDVTSPQIEIDEIVKKAVEIYGGIDVLVNNAGYNDIGTVEELTQERLNACLATNLHGPINLTRAILPHFREKNRGTLVYVGSKQGWQGDAGSAPYCASKFALEGVLECLASELAMISPGIKLTIFEAGLHHTQMLSPQNIRFGTSTIPVYARLNEALQELVDSLYNNKPNAYGFESGDPKMAVERMIEVVKGDGMAAGKTMPLRMPLGSDSLKIIMDKCEDTLKICNEWKDVAVSTDSTSSS